MNETTEKQPEPTAYTVLRQESGTGEPGEVLWHVLDVVKAAGAGAARAAAFADLPESDQREGATLVAVPSRSWQPKRRELQPRSVES